MVSAPGLRTPKTAVLAGPTAAGKTALALETRAPRPVEIEIINADSMQVYRGMDIGTAKPTPEELAQVPHHLIDIRDPDEPFTAGEFIARTAAALRGHPPPRQARPHRGRHGLLPQSAIFRHLGGPPGRCEIRAQGSSRLRSPSSTRGSRRPTRLSLAHRPRGSLSPDRARWS